MKCPMLSLGLAYIERGLVEGTIECLQEGCAWWDSVGGACAIKGIRHSLRTLCVESIKVAAALTLIRPK